MADLLGNILGSMEKPPSAGDKEKKLAKQRKKQMEKIQEADKKRKSDFRLKVEKEVNEFTNNETSTRLRYEPMDRVYRSIIYDVAEVAGLTSFSFGERDEERYLVLFKKEFAPTDEELAAYRSGKVIEDPEKAREYYRMKAQSVTETTVTEETTQDKDFVPTTNYRDKYKKLIGDVSAKEGAHTLAPNKQFGFVPSESKTDKRSIEEMMNDIRAKKKQKLLEHSVSTTQEPSSSSE
ncbi:sperm-associated antigen 7 homolog [Saccoglossus kowalevskii]|uniref:Sperm-associated antigen 7 homolog n=1 Tax=Saccoglossus kowalevskii TaxID=10224 RepID=A0ABM0GMJ8_SACKO|nr:PREDICTED: sperm-associated antigen 7 homolog [Saccoglossus kowalevskii]